MISRNTWSLDAKFLDACMRELRKVAADETLRKYDVMYLPKGGIDAHASSYARAYRVKEASGSFACLRFWVSPPEETILATYAALECAPEVLARVGLSQVRLFTEAVRFDRNSIPAILMDWVEGSELASAIDMHLGAPMTLRRIAEELRSKFVSLNERQISHGDLRASNILIAVNSGTIRVGLIDLDSLRWQGGLTCERVIGGHRMWDHIRHRDGVHLLESDYLDQAMTYLTVVAVAAERSWWRGSTDHFLTFKHLKPDPQEVFSRLERMGGLPARVAGAVKHVMADSGHWSGLAEAMRQPISTSLTAESFWNIAIEGRASRKKIIHEEVCSLEPEPLPDIVEPVLEAESMLPVPEAESATPQHRGSLLKQPVQGQWFWILIVIVLAIIGIIVYWLRR